MDFRSYQGPEVSVSVTSMHSKLKRQQVELSPAKLTSLANLKYGVDEPLETIHIQSSTVSRKLQLDVGHKIRHFCHRTSQSVKQSNARRQMRGMFTNRAAPFWHGSKGPSYLGNGPMRHSGTQGLRVTISNQPPWSKGLAAVLAPGTLFSPTHYV